MGKQERNTKNFVGHFFVLQHITRITQTNKWTEALVGQRKKWKLYVISICICRFWFVQRIKF